MRALRIRLPALALVAAAVGVSAWRLPGVFRDAQRQVDAVHGLTRAQRALLPGRSFDLDTDSFVDAARAMPETAVYLVATGTNGVGASPTALAKVPVFAGYWFLPRRQTIDPQRATWVFSYGGDLAGLGLRYARILPLGPGTQLAEVRH